MSQEVQRTDFSTENFGTTAKTPQPSGPVSLPYPNTNLSETSNISLKHPFPTLLPIQTAHFHPGQKPNQTRDGQTDTSTACTCTHGDEHAVLAQGQRGDGWPGSVKPWAALRGASRLGDLLPSTGQWGLRGDTWLQAPALDGSQALWARRAQGIFITAFSSTLSAKQQVDEGLSIPAKLRGEVRPT